MSLPKVLQLDFTTEELNTVVDPVTVHKSYAWDFERGDFALAAGSVVEIEGVEYLRVWIEKALRTVKGTLIYNGTNYGSDHHGLIGQVFKRSFTESEYERMIRECLRQNTAITSVTGFTFTPIGSRLKIEFSVMSIYGQSEEVVTI